MEGKDIVRRAAGAIPEGKTAEKAEPLARNDRRVAGDILEGKTEKAVPLARNESVARLAKIPQRAGCLPEGYDENSFLTPEQFAVWKQLSIKTVRNRLPLIPGLVRNSRRDQRIHVKTHLAVALKRG